MIGTKLGHYEITSKLGEGGMGVVYRARDTRLNRDVAIKVLPAEMVANPERRQRFIQEAQAASALNHPNIITIHEIGQDEGTDFMVMEHVPGQTLGDRIPAKGLPLREALRVAVQVADALSAAHSANILHRDLKPGNIMVSDEGRVKVLDFGLAKLTECATASELDVTATVVSNRQPVTVDGTILGTVSYMSPEQAEGKKLDSRSDIFSFGALLYEMLTGRQAFSGGSTVSTLAAILDREPKPVSEIVGPVPRDVEKLISRCLRKDRSRRIQTMADLKVSLDELLEDPGPATSAPETAPSPAAPSHSPLRWIVAALIALVFFAVGWFIRPIPTSLQQDLSPTPLTAYPGREDFPTFSPDGNQVAFSWNGTNQDNFDIYVQVVGAGSPVRLTTDTATEFSPDWSPDGRHIAFLRVLEEGRAEIVLVPALGGAERRLSEIELPFGPVYSPGTLIDWSPDSRRLVVCQADLDSFRAASLFALDIETGEQWPLTSSQATSEGDFGPTVAPDGRSLAFVRRMGPWQGDVYQMPLSPELKPDGEPRRLTQINLDVGSPTWTKGGEIFFLAGTFGGQRWLWRVNPAANKPAERLLAVNTETRRLTSSGSGRIVFADTERITNIWQLDLDQDRSVAGPPRPLITSTKTDNHPRFSPDGRRVTFVSSRSGSLEIWASDSDGENPVQLSSFPGLHVWGPNWSPDGKQIVFQVSIQNGQRIYTVNAGGGAPRELTADYAATPSWSRDGKWVYFASNRTGILQIWKISAGGGDAIQVSPGAGVSPVESPDGRFVYYSKPGTDWLASVWRVPASGGEETKVIDSVPTIIDFAVTEDGIYYLDGDAVNRDNIPLKFLDVSTNEAKTISLLPSIAQWGLTVSPDRRTILFSQRDHYESDLTMLELPE